RGPGGARLLRRVGERNGDDRAPYRPAGGGTGTRDTKSRAGVADRYVEHEAVSHLRCTVRRLERLRLGVIGTGGMGSHHARNAATYIPAAEVVALADVDVDRARGLAAQLGALAVYDAAEDLIGDPNVTAVIITSPPSSHAGLIS